MQISKYLELWKILFVPQKQTKNPKSPLPNIFEDLPDY